MKPNAVVSTSLQATSAPKRFAQVLNFVSSLPAAYLSRTSLSRGSLCLKAMTMVCVFSVAASSAWAQDNDRRRSGRSSFDIESYLNQRDTNKNGRLDRNEFSEGGRTERFLKGMGIDTSSSSISIKKIVAKAAGDRKKMEEKQNSNDPMNSGPKVPGFGVNDGVAPRPTFGAADVAPLTTKFSDKVIADVDQTLARYDRNKDYRLDRDEIRRARWGSPSPADSDTNGDGKLSRTELLNRYYLREQYSRDAKSKSESAKDKKVEDSRRSGDRRRFTSSSANNSTSRSYGSPRSSSSSRGSTRSSSRTSPTRITSKTVGASPADDRSKYENYVSGLMKNYDKDNDGKLSKTEIKSMRRPPTAADSDKDGFISKDELIDSLSGKNKKTATATTTTKAKTDSKSSRSGSKSYSSSRKSRSSGRSGSFSSLDKDQDNRVEMHEFSTEWDDKKVEEFYEKDKNGDGVITAKEWSAK